jgi:hypothetical protein
MKAIAVVRCAWLIIAGVIAAMLIGLPTAKIARSATYPGVPNQTLNGLFNGYGENAGCASWSGADSTNVLDLEDGNKAWFFSDTYLGSPQSRYEDGGFFHSSLHNSIVMQAGGGLGRTITGGNTCSEHDTSKDFWDRYAQTPITPRQPDAGWFWNNSATLGEDHLPGDTVVAYYYHAFAIADSFGLDYATAVTIPKDAIESNNTLKVGDNYVLHDLKCPGASEQVAWGADVSPEPYNAPYEMYGWGIASGKLYYAQVPVAGEPWDINTWKFDTGNGVMSGDCRRAKPMPIQVEAGFGITASADGTYWLIQHDRYSQSSGKILAYPSSTPYGFDGKKAVVLYDAPELPHGSPYWQVMYDVRLLNTDQGVPNGDFVFSYNVNTTGKSIGCGSENNRYASIYRPRFVNVPYSALKVANAVSTDSIHTAESLASSTSSSKMLAGHGISDFGPQLPGLQPPSGELPSGKSASAIRAMANNTWYDGQAYSSNGGCPLLQNEPATSLSGVADAEGTVSMDWGLVGLDVWYWIYWKDATKGGDWRKVELWSYGPSFGMNPVTSADVNGHRFCFYIQPFASGNTAINGPPSNQLCGTDSVQRPNAPSNVTAIGWDINTAKVTWTGSTYPSSHVFYYVHYRTGSDAWTRVGPWDENTRSALVAPLTGNRIYDFYVTAVNVGGESDPSNVASADVPSTFGERTARQGSAAIRPGRYGPQ